MSGTILVTGAQGFVGRYFIAEVLTRAPSSRIVGLGRSERKNAFTHDITVAGRSVPAPTLDRELTWGAGAPDYRRIDVTDRGALIALVREIEPRCIVHLASGLRDDHYSHLMRTNVEGTITLLEAVAESRVAVERIVLGSSGSVYGKSAIVHERLQEELACEPADIYAVSKLAAEQAARIVARERDLPIVIGRIFNVVGPGQEERHVVGRFASQIAAIEAGAKATIAVGDLSPLRDFIDVRDVARGLADLCASGVSDTTYNVATGRATPISEILETLMAIAEVRTRVDVLRSYVRPADVPRFVADISKIAALGFSPRYALRESLGATLDYYRKVLRSEAVTATPSSLASSFDTQG